MTRRLLLALSATALLLLVPGATHAQDPTRTHRTLATPHFDVHYTPELEPIARRAAASAERAYARLAIELHPPRGRIDMLVADNVDYANGSASVSPANRIVIYAHPPIDSPTLRFNDDWIDLVVTHELAHVFHLDRSRGAWRLLQHVFGRSPVLFPNGYSPRWLTEGIATFYESKLTGSGRLVGSSHNQYIMAAALGGKFPRPDQLSVATPVFPGGQGVYIFGALFVSLYDGSFPPGAIRRLVDAQAVHPVPFLVDRASRAANGRSLSAFWRDVEAVVEKDVPAERLRLGTAWRDVTPPLHGAEFLRWTIGDRLVYTGSAPRERFGAYAVTPDGRRTYLGRRNGATPHSRTADGTLVYAQPDFTDPYSFRGDLYADRGGDVERLTRGARISAPDARADGRIVAVQAIPGGSRLVTYDPALRALRTFAEGSADEYWAEPRWSPDGSMVAATHWQRGGSTSIVILDSAGAVRERIGTQRAVQGAPSWSADGRHVVFTSDIRRVSQAWVAAVGTGAAPRPLFSTTDVVFHPQLSPDGTEVAAVRLTGDGMRVSIAPLGRTLAEVMAAPAGEELPYATPVDTAPLAPHAGGTRRYSALRQLLPRYWFPVVESSAYDTRIGAYTSGEDILGRHSYVAQVGAPVKGRGVEGGVSYQYAGLRVPLVGLSAWQDYAYRQSVLNPDGSVAARVDRVQRDASLSATFLRPRVRSNLTLTVAGGATIRHNSLSRDIPVEAPAGYFADSVFPRVSAAVAYARTVSAPYAISPEDGFTASLGALNHWARGDARPSALTVTSALTGYKSFDLFGFARHVAAVRVAAGMTSDEAIDELEVGGVSGSTIPLAFGLASLGEGRRTFPVRGFREGTLYGTRAWAASAEYRAPLAMLARGAGLLPVFLDRTSVSVFGDAGSAWCHTYVAAVCRQDAARTTIASVGAEARVVAAIGSWDSPFALRLGAAVPVRGTDRPAPSVYLTSGLSF